MKRKFILTLLCVSLAVFAAAFISGCGRQKNAEEIARENGATVKVTLDLAGGVSGNNKVRYLLISPGSPIVLPWEHTTFINPPSREGYTFVGFYTGTADDDGNITYGTPWDYSTKIYEDMTLYAFWSRNFAFRVLPVYEDGKVGDAVKTEEVIKGATFDSSERHAAAVPGYTFIEYYKDAEMTQKWDATTTHPGFPEGITEETATEEDFYYDVYAYYVEGEYKKVVTASDFTAATNYWLIGDENGVIDFDGAIFPSIIAFRGKIVGNGVTIKNINVTYSNLVGRSKIGLFGELEDATLSDVTFENCTVNVEYTRKPREVNAAELGFLAGTAKNTTLENVNFVNCALNISVKVNDGVAVLPVDYESELPAYWNNRAADTAGNNILNNVNGTVAVAYNN